MSEQQERPSPVFDLTFWGRDDGVTSVRVAIDGDEMPVRVGEVFTCRVVGVTREVVET